MQKSILAVIGLSLTCTPALASGGLSCEADDDNLKLTVESGVTTGMGGPFFAFKGTAEVKVEGTAADLRRLTLDDALVHHWLDGRSLNLSFYRETPNDKPHAEAEITIETVPADEGEYVGGYTLSLFAAEAAEDEENPKLYRGKVSCFVE